MAGKSDSGEQNWVTTGAAYLSKPTASRTTKYGYKTHRAPVKMCTSTYNKQFHTQTWGEQRVKYTTSNEGNVNQVCGKTRQNKWKMKGGLAMARRPVTSTAEHRPNKERN